MSLDLKALWDTAFLDQIGYVERKTGTNPNDWRTGGRKTVANPNKEDKAWWDENGYKMLQDFVSSFVNNKWKIWIAPDGKPGVELPFEVAFGDVKIKGFADMVLENFDGSLTVVDLKTGSSTPDSSLQLGVYASCIELLYGVRPLYGAYYDARGACLEPSAGIERWTIPVLTEMFAQFERGLQAEIFLPNVGMSCRTCGVKDYCYAVGGPLAKDFDPLAKAK